MFYALGDIHGQQAQFERALALIEADGGADAPLYFVGDLGDRGFETRWVIQTIMDAQAAGKPWHCILGNHDQMFHDFVTTGNAQHKEILSGKSWLHRGLGGMRTLASYMRDTEIDHPEWVDWEHATLEIIEPMSDGLKSAIRDAAVAAVPQDHMDWIENLPLYLDAPDGHRFVHAGVRPNVAMADQDPRELVWIRDGWLDHGGPLDAMYVHGHTALDFPQHHGNRINIDGGAGYGRALVPTGYDGTGWFTLDETGRSALRP